jgi:simple sugar transport system ATP-binding protein
MTTPTRPDATSPLPASALALAGIRKTFGSIVADDDASLTVAPGEIHALVGENGAGKSSLMRIASGLLAPDAGRVSFGARDVTGWSVADAITAGVGMVHQHFLLVPTLTVADNVVLGREPGRGPLYDPAEARRAVQALVDATALEVSVSQRVGDCSVGEAQRVEILKALYRGARILILDEPTAVLAPPEVERLWTVLRAHRATGGSVVLITHKLDEVMAISDTVTVMRAGRTVAHMPTATTTPPALAHRMFGDDRPATPAESPAARPTATLATRAPREAAAPVALDVRDLVVLDPRGGRAVDGVTLAVERGEILGIAGVEGNGQRELIETIAGLRAAAAGTIALDGVRIETATVRARRNAGLAHIPEDRQRHGLVLPFSVAENLVLDDAARVRSWPFGLGLDRVAIDEGARRGIAALDIRPAEPARAVATLSGGNQQKVVVARESDATARDDRPARVLLAAHPTRGVDVGAVARIHARLRDARDAGGAILLVAAELTELLALADRIVVMLRGRIVAAFAREDVTLAALGDAMTGAR